MLLNAQAVVVQQKSVVVASLDDLVELAVQNAHQFIVNVLADHEHGQRDVELTFDALVSIVIAEVVLQYVEHLVVVKANGIGQ